ncbi:MAG TPA: helix-turn-helix transcriptional regulator [Angustibacter sp.]|nr:helix-turn-helix transcriptional regulator [Angustibacter sp.]
MITLHGGTMTLNDDLDVAILRLVTAGHTNRAIAIRLHVSRDTVAHRLTSIMRRAHVQNRAHLVAHLVVTGAVSTDELASWLS